MNFSIGQKLVKQKEFGKALNVFSYLEKTTDDQGVLFYLGIIYFELNDYDKSILYYEKFLEKQPDSVNALYNLATVKQSIGEIQTAKNIYLQLMKLDIKNIRPYYGIFILDPNSLTSKHFNNISEIKKNTKLNLYDLGIANFILSKKEKKNKNYKNEIEYLKIFHSSIFNSNYSYNKSALFYYNKVINKFYDKIEIKTNDEKSNDDKELSPIFIVGLPRSGSTLIESILKSSEEKLKSFGECNVVNKSILEQIGPKIYTKDFDINKFQFQIDKKNLKDSILKRYHEFNFDINNKQIFIDKSLENIFNIEIILNIFPKAKFIHTYRNPVDSILSIYQSMLPELSWVHTLEDILEYIDLYYKILSYLKNKYPEAIMDLNLEKFSEFSEKFTKEIYKFCNLNWNDDSLKFYKRDDLFSKTLSFMQIRNKISKYDDKKYNSYVFLLQKFKNKYKWLKV